MEHNAHNRRETQDLWRWLAIVAVVLAIYVLGSGPAVYLSQRGLLSKPFVRAVYKPLVALEGFGPFDRYLQWWIEKGGRKS